jgi:hypothetical protein
MITIRSFSSNDDGDRAQRLGQRADGVERHLPHLGGEAAQVRQCRREHRGRELDRHDVTTGDGLGG